MQGLIAWVKRSAGSPWGDAGLFFISVLESTVLPFTIELVLGPLMLANRRKVWWFAAVALAGCIVGALIGYGLGYAAIAGAGSQMSALYGWEDQLAAFRETFQDHGFWALILTGITPVPFQIGMLTAGAAGYPLALFVLASAIARGVRYFGFTALVLLSRSAVQRWLARRTGTEPARQKA